MRLSARSGYALSLNSGTRQISGMCYQRRLCFERNDFFAVARGSTQSVVRTWYQATPQNAWAQAQATKTHGLFELAATHEYSGLSPSSSHFVFQSWVSKHVAARNCCSSLCERVRPLLLSSPRPPWFELWPASRRRIPRTCSKRLTRVTTTCAYFCLHPESDRSLHQFVSA